MKIKIPNINGEEKYIEDKQSIVLIGANGSGKTRMSIWIDDNNREIPIHRISAQKSLNMPQMVSPTELQIAEEKFL
jgi:polynucleotide 5'-kinase involved in rRNA processing